MQTFYLRILQSKFATVLACQESRIIFWEYCNNRLLNNEHFYKECVRKAYLQVRVSRIIIFPSS